MTLSCNAIGGNPGPTTVQWYRNDQPIATTAQYTFQPSRSDNDAEYKCELDNGYGTVENAGDLEVHCKVQ